ncbi:integrase core domain-containing protein [Paludibacterium paludis]|uniref:integrase core domain-containing protein n=1 Tax=Paludibacterium paludis TaxID=1225769 RepID=UPI001E557549|nr:transposase [Paludibacterium paludis]
MFIKVTSSGPRRYVQLVEAFRDEAGKPKQRTVATLGRLDQLGGELEFITPYTPEQNGMVERVIRSVKEPCVYRHRFESLTHASRVMADWISFYNNRRPYQALGMKTPARIYELAA